MSGSSPWIRRAREQPGRSDEHAAVFAATAADVTEVVIDGQVVFDGDHERVGRDLEAAIERVWA